MEFRLLILIARAAGYDVAAGNLQHWLTGGGAPRSVPLSWLRSYWPVTRAENKNQKRFEESLTTRAAQLHELPEGAVPRELKDTWDAGLIATPGTDLWYASGASQLHSEGDFKLSPHTGAGTTILGEVHQTWFDHYSWNEGEKAYIPGLGNVSDDVGLDLRDAGRGKDYLLNVQYVQTFTGFYVLLPWGLVYKDYTWLGP